MRRCTSDRASSAVRFSRRAVPAFDELPLPLPSKDDFDSTCFGESLPSSPLFRAEGLCVSFGFLPRRPPERNPPTPCLPLPLSRNGLPKPPPPPYCPHPPPPPPPTPFPPLPRIEPAPDANFPEMYFPTSPTTPRSSNTFSEGAEAGARCSCSASRSATTSSIICLCTGTLYDS